MSDKYNGWTNYETWVVKLWIDNEEGSSVYWNERAEECAKAGEEEAAIKLADALKSEFEEGSPCPEAGVYTDLLNAALSEVNWEEIAGSLLEDAGSPGLGPWNWL